MLGGGIVDFNKLSREYELEFKISPKSSAALKCFLVLVPTAPIIWLKPPRSVNAAAEMSLGGGPRCLLLCRQREFHGFPEAVCRASFFPCFIKQFSFPPELKACVPLVSRTQRSP